MSDWQPLKIRDLGRVVTGKTPPTESAEYYDGDELFVSPKDLTWNSYYVDSTATRISEKALDKFKGQVIPRDAVMFTSLSFAFGKMGIAGRSCITNQQINSIIVNDRHCALFVYYLLRAYEPHIFAYNSGIDTPIVPKSVFERIPVLVPGKTIQEKIAALLSAYDDLITNNQRRIALLESMAEEIYREWFVRMRFPQYATLKGDELMPPGWSRQPIGELAVLIKRGISPDYADQSEHQVINQKCIRGSRVSMSEARPHMSVVPDEKLLRFGDVLINSTGVGTLGRAAVFDIEADGITCDSHVTILRPKDVAVLGEFLAYTIQLLQPYFESMASGSTGQAELGRELIGRTKVLVPTLDLLKHFSDTAAPIRRQRRLLLEQNEKLSATRDQLLPRLISGKLRVDALDIQFPPSMQPSAESRSMRR